MTDVHNLAAENPVAASATGNVTDDALRVERSVEWRAAFDAGLKAGTALYFQSPVMEQLAIEITMLRAAVSVLTDAVARLKDDVAWYRDGYEALRDAWNARRSAP